jgi:uncharacterized protein YndB with AHSA1/START domain
MHRDHELPPLRKVIEVRVPPAEAFRLWTEAIGRWWPLASHSVGQADAVACVIEARTGGRIFETTRAGAEHLWGRITVFDPPHRLAFTWHPGRQPGDHTIVEVTFSPSGTGRTPRARPQRLAGRRRCTTRRLRPGLAGAAARRLCGLRRGDRGQGMRSGSQFSSQMAPFSRLA